MANSRTAAHRPLIGWLFLAAGVLFLLVVLFAYLIPSMSGSWLYLLGTLALAVAFLLVYLWESLDTLGRFILLIAAVGWALVALSSVVNIGALGLVGYVFAFIGTLVAGILVFLRHLFSARANLWFLIAMLVASLDLLNAIFGFLPSALNVIIPIALGVLLVVSGLFVAQRR